MVQTTQQAIRERAYQIWEEQGRPTGLDVLNWLQAEHEVTAVPTKKPVRTRTTTRRATTTRRKKAS